MENHAAGLHDHRQGERTRHSGGYRTGGGQDERRSPRPPLRILYRETGRSRRREYGQIVHGRLHRLVGVRAPKLGRGLRRRVRRAERLRFPAVDSGLHGPAGREPGSHRELPEGFPPHHLAPHQPKFLRPFRRARPPDRPPLRDGAFMGLLRHEPGIDLPLRRHSAGRNLGAAARGRTHPHAHDGKSGMAQRTSLRRVPHRPERRPLLRQGAGVVRSADFMDGQLGRLPGRHEGDLQPHPALGLQRTGIPHLRPPARRALPRMADGAFRLGHQPQTHLVAALQTFLHLPHPHTVHVAERATRCPHPRFVCRRDSGGQSPARVSRRRDCGHHHGRVGPRLAARRTGTARQPRSHALRPAGRVARHLPAPRDAPRAQKAGRRGGLHLRLLPATLRHQRRRGRGPRRVGAAQ